MTSPEAKVDQSHWLEAWHVNPSSNREYDFIDGLRGIAILMVLICHYVYVNPHSGPTMHYLGSLAGTGGTGISLFFLLSGFLISWPFWKRKFARSEQIAPRGYAQRRFWKIYPPMALTVIFFTFYLVLRDHHWGYLSLTAQWLSGLAFIVPVKNSLNPVMWTLVVEVQFYIVLPVVFICIKKASTEISFGIITLIFLVIPLTYQICTGLYATFIPEIDSHFPSTLSAFYLGILVAGLDSLGIMKKSWARVGWLGLALCPVCLCVLAWIGLHLDRYSQGQQLAVSWSEKLAFGCLLFYVANPKHPVAQILCTPWLRWCGIISYEWHLFHQPFILWSRALFGSANGNVGK